MKDDVQRTIILFKLPGIQYSDGKYRASSSHLLVSLCLFSWFVPSPKEVVLALVAGHGRASIPQLSHSQTSSHLSAYVIDTISASLSISNYQISKP